jgi:hypothetical protein
LHDQFDDAHALASKLSHLFTKTHPAAMIALAQSLHPGTEPKEALNLMRTTVGHVEGCINLYTRQYEAIVQAEEERLKPLLSQVVKRVFAIPAEIKRIRYTKTQAGYDVEERRKKLVDAKVPKADIDRIVLPPDTAKMDADIHRLRTEQDALELFIATKDESYLPDGFILVEPLKS